MKKEGLKAFIFSFSLSLATIMTANSFFASQQKINSKPIISNKNIVLFINKDNGIKTKPYPTKKIALNVLDNTDTKDIKVKSYTQPAITPPKPEDMVIMADNSDKFDYDYIPLNIEINPEPEVIKLAENDIEDIVAQDTESNIENIGAKEIAIAQNSLVIPNEEVAEIKADTIPEIKIADTNIVNFKEIKLIKQEENTSLETEETPSLLIPLEHGDKKNLKIIHDGAQRQVASTNKHAPVGIIANQNSNTQLSANRESAAWKTMEEHRAEKKNSDNSPGWQQ